VPPPLLRVRFRDFPNLEFEQFALFPKPFLFGSERVERILELPGAAKGFPHTGPEVPAHPVTVQDSEVSVSF
jgi:hypothetical protein